MAADLMLALPSEVVSRGFSADVGSAMNGLILYNGIELMTFGFLTECGGIWANTDSALTTTWTTSVEGNSPCDT